MPLMHETKDILGYYDDSRAQGEPVEAVRLGYLLNRLEEPFKRWPVRNLEPRTPIGSQKRALIHARDGDICRTCGVDDVLLTVDHIIPRSAFPVDRLHVADRSDNLVSMCWPCNEGKSNYERPQSKRLGVVTACWYCKNAYVGNEEPALGPVNRLVFCGRCGISHVPEIDGWVL